MGSRMTTGAMRTYGPTKYVRIGHELPENSDDENFLSYPPERDVVIDVPEQHVYNDGVGSSRRKSIFRSITISNYPNQQSIQNTQTKHTCSSLRLPTFHIST